jgi:hypothetical protein
MVGSSGRTQGWRPPLGIVIVAVIAMITVHVYLIYGDAWLEHTDVPQFKRSEVLDARFRYTIDDARAMVMSFGKHGVERYLRLYTDGADILYPPAYAALLTLLILRFQQPNSVLRSARFLPVIAACWDYLENTCHYVILTSYLQGDTHLQSQEAIRAAAASGGLFTPAKWTFFVLSLVYWLYLVARRFLNAPVRAHIE